MARRKPYTALEKHDQVRPVHVRGRGDVAFKGFQCPNPDCINWIFVRADEVDDAFEFDCDKCGRTWTSGEVVELYEYVLRDKRDESTIETGVFDILIDDYVAEAQVYKYCIICCTLKPLEMFDRHSARATGRQGECKLCKGTYNGLKNQTRISEQHREAAQKRRLYVDLGLKTKVDLAAVRARFDSKCFKCGKPVTPDQENLDHTLPVFYLWPLTTETATLLCKTCNGQKGGSWPNRFYSVDELRKLSLITGIDFDLLRGAPQINPVALDRLKTTTFVNKLLERYAGYMSEVIRLRNRVLNLTGVDLFKATASISDKWIRDADAINSKHHQERR